MNLIRFLIFTLILIGCSTEKGVSLEKIEIITQGSLNIHFQNQSKYSGRIYKKSSKNNLILEFNTKDGLYNGIYKEYFEDGILKKESNYYSGVLQGRERIFFKNGQLLEDVNYKSGNLNGVRNVYWNNGMMKEVNNFENGILVGESTYFYSNGILRKTISFDIQGRKDGLWISYDSDGKITKQLEFDKGKIK
tara:strand:+ start:335 stop:910 length:576 start_codon:yes stop_codon:yes gene_type:complete